MRSSLSYLLASLLVARSAISAAELVPARLAVGEHSIEELLRIPDGLPPGQYIVNCEGAILITGWAERFNCYAPPSVPRELIRAVTVAGDAAHFLPAMRDGQRIEVFMVMSTLVYLGKGGPLVLTVPNNGTDRERYGLLYSAPQSTAESRERRRVLRYRFSAHAQVPNDLLVWLKVNVAANGSVTGYTIDNASREPSRQMDEFERFIGRMDFIPGHHEGKPVPTLYAEPIYGR